MDTLKKIEQGDLAKKDRDVPMRKLAGRLNHYDDDRDGLVNGGTLEASNPLDKLLSESKRLRFGAVEGLRWVRK